MLDSPLRPFPVLNEKLVKEKMFKFKEDLKGPSEEEEGEAKEEGTEVVEQETKMRCCCVTYAGDY